MIFFFYLLLLVVVLFEETVGYFENQENMMAGIPAFPSFLPFVGTLQEKKYLIGYQPVVRLCKVVLELEL
jgi:hypothetical protein